ncbi:HsdM family class I SAM-dependent methyltransferase [Spirosoma linguale]|uniref:site-specific DNA-methyltransferase (adenine-specific) n=1 Tax=Spirosoma linguale (strain ATCC 33905 / DSM 74 / LMG 10896 / Claus 1) TaxID=504472 RepID=D2QLF2_SPILD|nr:Site-specific DNA-methyltransferase (adenine- specific) [Spirosoma linguale DSM 74]
MAHNLSGIIKSIRDIMREDRGVNGDAQRIEQLGWMLFLKIFDDKDIEMELLADDYQSPIPTDCQWRNWAADNEGITGDELQQFVDLTLFPTLKNLPVKDGNRRALLIREVFEGNNNYMKSGINIRKICNKLNEIDFNSSEDRHLFGDLYEGILKELQSAGDSGEFYTPRAVTQFMTEMVNPRLGEIIFDPACGTGGFLVNAIEHIRQREVNSVDDRLTLQKTIRGCEYKPLPYELALTNLILHDIEVPNIEYGDSLGREYSSIRDRDRVDVILANPPFGGTVANGNEGNFPANFRTRESADLFLVLIVNLLRTNGRAALVLPDGSLTGEGVKQRVRQKLLEDCDLHTIVRLPNSVFQPYATVATNLLFFEKKRTTGLAAPDSDLPLFSNGETNDSDRYATREIWYYEHRLPEGQKSYSKTKTIQLKEFEPLKAWWTNRVESDQAWRVPIQTIIDRKFDLDIKNPNRKEEVMEFNSTELIDRIIAGNQRVTAILEKLKIDLVA